MAARRTRSGTIVVAIVLVLGLGLGSLGAWWVVRARPQPGDFIDALAVPGGAVVVRHERSSGRAFVELYEGDRLRWRALVPAYAGRAGVPALAASPRSVTVRTVRGGRPYMFAFDTPSGAKLDSFALLGEVPADPTAYTLPNLATVSSGGEWAAEVLVDPANPGGALVIGVSLGRRGLAWKRNLAWIPTDGWFEGDVLVLDGGPRQRAGFAMADGAPAATTAGPPRSPPPRHRTGGGRELVVTPRSIAIVDTATGATVGTIR